MVALRSLGESSAAVAEEGLGAIENLSAGNATNRTRLGEAGVCEGLLQRLACVVCSDQCYLIISYFVFSSVLFDAIA